MQSISLNSGKHIPAIGFGTWEITPDAAARDAVTEALQAGYRLTDTARIYGNETGVGEAIKNSGVPRGELFITTKLWNSDQGYESALKAFDASLGRLSLEYIDLYLIHWPVSPRRNDSWRALEEIHASGRAQTIGVSNYTVKHLEELLDHSNITPAVNQVEFHPFIYEQQRELLEFCKSRKIVIEAYSPLSRLRDTRSKVIEEIAEKVGKTSQQVVLRWCFQHGTVSLSRSTKPEHIQSNLDIFDFELSDEDMNVLNNISDGERVTWDPTTIK